MFGETGVTLDVVGLDLEDDMREAWRRRVMSAARQFGWPEPRFATFVTDTEHTLGFTAPVNQLRTACETNEWALCAALLERDPAHWGSLREMSCLAAYEGAVADAQRQRPPGATHPGAARVVERAALDRLRRLAQAEALAPRAS